MSLLDSPDDLSYLPHRTAERSKSPRSTRTYTSAVEEDYASSVARFYDKTKPHTTPPHIQPQSVGAELVMEGVPVAALVMAVIGGIWMFSAINADDSAYIFPAAYMTLGCLFLFAVSTNIKKRFRRAMGAFQIRSIGRKTAQ